MATLLVFLLGIGNFAAHRAVLESGHKLLAQMPWFKLFNGKVSLTGEFCVLLGALLLVANGHEMWGWVYLAYSLINGASAWAMLSGRI